MLDPQISLLKKCLPEFRARDLGVEHFSASPSSAALLNRRVLCFLPGQTRGQGWPEVGWQELRVCGTGCFQLRCQRLDILCAD